MKRTFTVLFVLSMLVASTQTFRHIYVKWIEPRDSVLDEFKDDVESNIEQARSLEELVVLYREAHENVKEYESDPKNPRIKNRERDNIEPYKSEIKIRREITAREYDENQLFKLCFFWLCGLVSLLVGMFAFRRINPWIGGSFIIVGFSEMLCWTSPLFHNRTLSQQFESLLNYKLLFSLITYAILIVLWLLIGKKDLWPEQNG